MAWLNFYGLIRDYSDERVYQDPKNDKKTKTVYILNVQVIKLLCDEFEIDFLTAFSMLGKINRAFQEG